jgi:hypothetical protein
MGEYLHNFKEIEKGRGKYSVNPLPSSEKQHFPAKAGIT